MGQGNNTNAAINLLKNYANREVSHHGAASPGLVALKLLGILGGALDQRFNIQDKIGGCLQALCRVPA